MRRFFIDPENIQDSSICIPPEEARHIERVLRLKTGDIVVFFDGAGQEYQVKLAGKKNGALTGQIIRRDLKNSEPTLKLYLAQGIAKGEKMDAIIRKTVEVGIKAIYPISCERSVVRLKGERADKRVERWQTIAREACKQCRRNVVPEIKPVMDFPSLLQIIGERPALMLYEDERRNGLKAWLRTEQYNNLKEMFILVGPEGGFADNEVLAAAGRGINIASLGPRILRTETAGLVAASMILYEYGDLG